MIFRKTKFFKILFILLCLLPVPAYAQGSNVNVLTWWGYLDKPWVSDIVQKECHVNLSYDEYYSSTEFFRRLKEQKNNYDIVIFADTIYETIKDEIQVYWESTISSLAKQYHPIVRKKYNKEKYPSNTVFLAHSIAGFLHNPSLFTINEEDDIHSLFKKANNKIVILMDDPVETRLLVDAFSIETFKHLSRNSRLFVTNEFGQLYNRHDFAFSYHWSGQAIQYARDSHKNYKFYVHPKYAYFASDLLVALKNSPAIECVVKTLGSKKFLTRLQNETYYFSPYGNSDNIDDPDFKILVEQTFLNLNSYYWVNSIPQKEFENMNKIWNKIKLEANHADKNVT